MNASDEHSQMHTFFIWFNHEISWKDYLEKFCYRKSIHFKNFFVFSFFFFLDILNGCLYFIYVICWHISLILTDYWQLAFSSFFHFLYIHGRLRVNLHPHVDMYQFPWQLHGFDETNKKKRKVACDFAQQHSDLFWIQMK